MPHVLEWTQSPKMPQVPLILESQGTLSPRGCNRMLHVLGSGQCPTKVSRTTRANSNWSLWSKTCEVTGANIRRGLPKIVLSSLIPPRTEGCYSLSLHILRWPAGCPASLLLHRQGGRLADPASLYSIYSIQPTTRGQSCSSQLIFKEISSPFKLYKTLRSDVLQENFNQHLNTRLDRIANAELYDHKARRRHRTAN
ncbi:unnamed protein product [Pleuronectes platessa]|uniref:Uncharacterized protein n=1 Tax=Pleuronectes platessa TaxID=8262 RepID=A0A9N7V518_PLEPL|nr:unnamed protein product [Pleuronectes platessa]